MELRFQLEGVRSAVEETKFGALQHHYNFLLPRLLYQVVVTCQEWLQCPPPPPFLLLLLPLL